MVKSHLKKNKKKSKKNDGRKKLSKKVSKIKVSRDSGFWFDTQEEKELKKQQKRKEEIQNLLCTDDKIKMFSGKKRGTPGQCFKKGYATSFVTDFSKNPPTDIENLTSEEVNIRKLFQKNFSNDEIRNLMDEYSINDKFPIRFTDDQLKNNIKLIFKKDFSDDEIKKLIEYVNDKFRFKNVDEELRQLQNEIIELKSQIKSMKGKK